MTTMTMVKRMMMSVLAPVITYVHFSTVLTHLTPFQYSWFHIIFVLGAMYVAMLLTDWYENIPRISVDILINIRRTQEFHPCGPVIAFDRW